MTKSSPSGTAFSEDRVAIGNRLRAERERLGLTQDELADELGLSRQSLVYYERGERSPLADQLLTLERLGGDAAYVVTGRRIPASDGEALERALQSIDALSLNTGIKLTDAARLKWATVALGMALEAPLAAQERRVGSRAARSGATRKK